MHTHAPTTVGWAKPSPERRSPLSPPPFCHSAILTLEKYVTPMPLPHTRKWCSLRHVSHCHNHAQILHLSLCHSAMLPLEKFVLCHTHTHAHTQTRTHTHTHTHTHTWAAGWGCKHEEGRLLSHITCVHVVLNEVEQLDQGLEARTQGKDSLLPLDVRPGCGFLSSQPERRGEVLQYSIN
jgi:hypothetical protein